MNNKGQSLILFIVFIPLVIMAFAFVIDSCYTKYNLNKLNAINNEIIRYGLSNIDNNSYDDMVSLIEKNDSEISNYIIDIDSESETITVTLEKQTSSFFKSILNKETYNIKSKYIGRIENDKIIIEEMN